MSTQTVKRRVAGLATLSMLLVPMAVTPAMAEDTNPSTPPVGAAASTGNDDAVVIPPTETDDSNGADDGYYDDAAAPVEDSSDPEEGGAAGRIPLRAPVADGVKFLAGSPHYMRGTTPTGNEPPSSIDYLRTNGAPVPVVAAGAGRITKVGGFGMAHNCMMTIDHGNGYQTSYVHLYFNRPWSIGDTVSEGQLIGEGIQPLSSRWGGAGNCGHGTANHVHFSVRQSGRLTDIRRFDLGGYYVGSGTRPYHGARWYNSDTDRIVPAVNDMYSGPLTNAYHTPEPKPPTKPLPGSVALNDQNGDKLSDVMGVGSDGRLHGYLSHGTRSMSNMAPVGNGWQSFRWVGSVPDLNKDGHSELLAIRNDETLWLYYGAGKGWYPTARQVGNGWGDFDLLTVMKDVNGNGFPELVGRRKSDHTLVLYPLVNSAGAFGASRVIGWNWGGMRELTTMDDFSGDNHPDLMAVTATGDLMNYRFGADGSLIDSGTKVGNGWNAMNKVFSPGDMTGDGRRDLLGRTATGDLMLYPSAGAGHFAAATKVGVGFNTIRLLF